MLVRPIPATKVVLRGGHRLGARMWRAGRTHQLGEPGEARGQEVQEFRSAFLRQTANSALAKPSRDVSDTPRSSSDKASNASPSQRAEAVQKKAETCIASPFAMVSWDLLPTGSPGSRPSQKTETSAICLPLRAASLAMKQDAGFHGVESSASVDDAEQSTRDVTDRSTSKTSVSDSDMGRPRAPAHADAVSVDLDADHEYADIFSSQVGLPLERISSQSPCESSNSPAVSRRPSRVDSPGVVVEWRAGTEVRADSPRRPSRGAVRRAREECSPALQEYIRWLEARQPEQASQPSASRQHSSTVNSMGSVLFPENLSLQSAQATGRTAKTANSLASSNAAELIGDREEADRALRDYILWLEVNDARAASGRRASFTINSLASSDAVDLQSIYEAETSKAVEKYCAWRQMQEEADIRPAKHASLSMDSLASDLIPSSPSPDAIQWLLEQNSGHGTMGRKESGSLQVNLSEGSGSERSDSKKRALTVLSLPPLDEVSDYVDDDLFTSSGKNPSSGNNTMSARVLSSSSGSTARAQLLSKSSGSGRSDAARRYVDPGTLLSFESEGDGLLDDQLLSSEGGVRFGQASRGLPRASGEPNTTGRECLASQNHVRSSGSVIKHEAMWPPVDPETLRSFEGEASDHLSQDEFPLRSLQSMDRFERKAVVPMY